MTAGRTRKGTLRLVLIVCLAGVVVAVALVAGVLMLNRSRSTVDTRLTHGDLRSFNAERISAEIAERGPVLFSDTTGGDRDFIVQHVGGDPLSGWSAFEARRPGQRRECFFAWRGPGERQDDADALSADPASGGGVQSEPDERQEDADQSDGRSAGGSFVNTCDPGDSVDAGGSGLAQYRVAVDGGTVTIDIGGTISEADPMPASEPEDPPQREPDANRSDLLEGSPGQQ